jgi:hypothetical protein
MVGMVNHDHELGQSQVSFCAAELVDCQPAGAAVHALLDVIARSRYLFVTWDGTHSAPGVTSVSVVGRSRYLFVTWDGPIPAPA